MKRHSVVSASRRDSVGGGGVVAEFSVNGALLHFLGFPKGGPPETATPTYMIPQKGHGRTHIIGDWRDERGCLKVSIPFLVQLIYHRR